MERISLNNLHEQFDSLKSTSIPQVKRYFRRRIVKCINECKQQALNVKKAVEMSNSNKSDKSIDQMNEYEIGWGSDFDDADEDDDDGDADDNNDNISNLNSTSSLNITNLSHKTIGEEQLLQSPNLSHSISLQSLANKDYSWSSMKQRPISEPPPPPLPKHPPPNVMTENVGNNLISDSTRNPNSNCDDLYELMNATGDNNGDEMYLLPNTMVQPANKCASVLHRNSSQMEANYECIRYNKFDSHLTNSSDSGSVVSSSSRSNLKFESDVILNDQRPLPPIPSELNTEELILASFSWFHQIEREEAERILRKTSIGGAYLVRKSRRAGLCNPYTLTLYHDGRIFHLNIRRRSDGLYALGKEKNKEKTFQSVAELIEFHKSEPIFLTSKGLASGKSRLIYTPT